MRVEDTPILVEKARGCGYRKKGGLYLRADAPSKTCCRLPHILHVCPTCGEGFRPSRAPRWVDPQEIFHAPQDEHRDWSKCGYCPLTPAHIGDLGRSLLIWIGNKFYPTSMDFLREANDVGISRRITSIPQDFKLGETTVLLAHRQVEMFSSAIVQNGDLGSVKPPRDKAIFMVFKPERIEYVCKGSESTEELDALAGRGITPVRVVKDVE